MKIYKYFFYQTLFPRIENPDSAQTRTTGMDQTTSRSSVTVAVSPDPAEAPADRENAARKMRSLRVILEKSKAQSEMRRRKTCKSNAEQRQEERGAGNKEQQQQRVTAGGENFYLLEEETGESEADEVVNENILDKSSD